jgi:hypothetical protein
MDNPSNHEQWHTASSDTYFFADAWLFLPVTISPASGEDSGSGGSELDAVLAAEMPDR